tara:strand:+ start:173 stop:436 length:264 start_codon:yes stop_codon:yes gene_type:complete
MYYKTPINTLYWYDSGTPLSGLPDGSLPITNDEARALIGCELHGPSPYPSWVLHESESYWQPPTPMPTDGKMYDWDEATLSWTEVTP